ncbi:LECA protein, partial [Atractosteus spatula]|nr:LECA protein [Atractosteus spatula]
MCVSLCSDLNKASIDLFRQGTQPSRAILVDLNTGIPRLPLSEMDRTYVLSGHKNEGEHLEITELKVPALIKGLHAAPSVPVRNDILNQGPPTSSQTKIIEHPKPNGSSIDYRKQGTQPSQAILVDMMSGLPRIPASEMERNYRTTDLNKASIDLFRQGTQSSRAVLVDLNTGIPRLPLSKMDRTYVLSESERCQGQVIDGKCYQFFASPRTFSDAESTCRELFPGGHLASVTSPALHSHLISLVINTNGGPALTWLGAFNFNHLNNGQFVWTDDSAWDYTAWLPGQPHIQGKENCLEMFKMGKSLRY